MGALRLVVLSATLLVPTWAIYPGYFGFPSAAGPFYPAVIPQQYQPQPLFSYSIYTAPSSAAVASPAPMAKSIYTAPDDTFRGYSFQTEYEGGGKSEVVFVTGPQANQVLQKSVELIRTIAAPEPGEITGRSLIINTTNISTTPAPISTESSPGSPVASFYRVQLYPAQTSPIFGAPAPLQNLISSFAYSITNDIAATATSTAENAGEAQESMIQGTTVTSPAPAETPKTTSPPQTTTQPPTEETSTTSTATTTTTIATPTSTSAPSQINQTPAEETNEVSDSSTTTAASDEIMETTST
ncbi:uncharacterized protein [Periplaneta americana]|uniref:uncharacterized protein n=1 Tax=Periplaneta americana TaxID=6978 RepID=UPI0037E8AC21